MTNREFLFLLMGVFIGTALVVNYFYRDKIQKAVKKYFRAIEVWTPKKDGIDLKQGIHFGKKFKYRLYPGPMHGGGPRSSETDLLALQALRDGKTFDEIFETIYWPTFTPGTKEIYKAQYEREEAIKLIKRRIKRLDAKTPT